ncbi:hypothetical protein BDF19DRAFT_428964 [Syncephalis fuscata]|nr:hypothetical protein BDF19DRAFT_428964 [Syncephalis fuscata]
MGYNIIWSTKDHLLDINPLGQLSCLDFMEKAEYLPDTKHQIRSNSRNCAATSFGLTTSTYAVQMHDRRLLWIGAVFMPPLFVPVWATLFQSDIYMADSGCTIEFPRYVPIFRAIIDIIINILFSAIFLKAVIKQYRAFGTDGIFYSIGVIASNIISSLLLVFEIFGPITQMVFLGDWILTSMLLIRQNASLSTAFTDNHPKTRQYSIMDQSTE